MDHDENVIAAALLAAADRIRQAVEDPTPDQVAAWVELAELLRDPDYVAASRRMAQRARAEGPDPDVARFEVGKAVGEQAGAAHRAGLDDASPQALAVVQRLEALTPGHPENHPEHRARVAERIEAFTDRRVARYWTLVGITNGLAPDPGSRTRRPRRRLDLVRPSAPRARAGRALKTARRLRPPVHRLRRFTSVGDPATVSSPRVRERPRRSHHEPSQRILGCPNASRRFALG